MKLFGHSKPEEPPSWTPATQESHALGLVNEASDDELERGIRFCNDNPLHPARFISSAGVERIQKQRCRAWAIEKPSNFPGSVTRNTSHGTVDAWRIKTKRQCRDTCLLSDLPILGALYETSGKRGVYFEVSVLSMRKESDVIAIGNYPSTHSPVEHRLN